MANKDRQQNYTNDNKPQDYYEQEYRRQLDEFNRISGAGGQRVQQIDEGVNDFDDYYDAGYPDDHTQGTAQPYGQGSRSSSDYAGSYRESTPRRQTQSRQTSRPQNGQSKQRGSGKSAKSNKTSAQRRNNDLQFGKNNKSRNGQTNKKVKTKWKIKKTPYKNLFQGTYHHTFGGFHIGERAYMEIHRHGEQGAKRSANEHRRFHEQL